MDQRVDLLDLRRQGVILGAGKAHSLQAIPGWKVTHDRGSDEAGCAGNNDYSAHSLWLSVTALNSSTSDVFASTGSTSIPRIHTRPSGSGLIGLLKEGSLPSSAMSQYICGMLSPALVKK